MTPPRSSGQAPALPGNPNLGYYRNCAKDLLTAHRNGDTSCCDTLRQLEHLAGNSDEDILCAQATLAQGMAFDGEQIWALDKKNKRICVIERNVES